MTNDLNLGITSFYASLHKIDECEINGLPRLPYSVNIIGRFEELKALKHSNLMIYLDAKRDKHERIVIATEYFDTNFYTNPPDITKLGKEKCVEIFYQLTSAVEYLHHSGIIVRNISPRNIFWANNNNSNNENLIKLGNHGLYFMTNSGLEIDFPIGYVPYLPPECILEIFNKNQPKLTCPRSDVWSIGIILMQTLCKGVLPDFFNDLETITKYTLDCFITKKDFTTEFILDNSLIDNEEDLLLLAKKCLSLEIYDRISITNLKKKLSSLRSSYSPSEPTILSRTVSNNIPSNHCKFSIPNHEIDPNFSYFPDSKERYFFWTLTGGDLWKFQAQVWDYQKKIPSILTLPILIRKDGEEYWSSSIAQSVKQSFCDLIYPLPGEKLIERLSKLPKTIFVEPKLKLPEEFKPFDFSKMELMESLDSNEIQIRSQPVWVKEKDFEYQLRRVIRFKRLINGYPLTKKALFKEASFDIPPLLRAEIWPLLLGVDLTSAIRRYTEVQGIFLEDKAASQITVDLPRCHSYDEFIVSSSGQEKLSRILHAWLLHHSYLEYTQGMDSLCAVFVRLLFNQEAVAFACLEAFVNKFMRGLFCMSHGQALNEYCLVLQQLLAFHKPHLSQSINIFSITGFTASWIYTGFAHSLSLDKTLRLWDTVILGEPSFLMMIFIALLGQLDQESKFSTQATEQVFSVLSNLQEFDLDSCSLEAIELAQKTPCSITYRSMAVDSTIIAKFVDPQYISISPRISLDDLLLIMNESISNSPDLTCSPFSFNPDQLTPPVLIDLRIKENYQKGSLPGSIHIPVVSASPHTTFTELETYDTKSTLSKHVDKLKVIIGTVDNKICEMVAKILVHTYHFQYVCILKGGINTVHAHRPDLLIVTH